MADRKKLIEMNKTLCVSIHCNYDEFQDAMSIDTLITAENLIANGVVIPVRCKDCKHYVDGPYDNGDMMCDCWGEWIFPDDNDFCSCGERKDNG